MITQQSRKARREERQTRRAALLLAVDQWEGVLADLDARRPALQRTSEAAQAALRAAEREVAAAAQAAGVLGQTEGLLIRLSRARVELEELDADDEDDEL